MASTFTPGEAVVLLNAAGAWIPGRALSSRDRDLVWVCGESEWDRARGEGREPDGLPWPAEDVRAAANS